MADVEGTVFLSEETEDAPIQLVPGSDLQTLWFENLYEELTPCEKGEDVKGDAWIDEMDPERGEKRRMSVEFELPDGTITARGVIEFKDGKRKGKLPAHGSGLYADWKGHVRLEECNPKRWIFEPPLPTS